MTVDKRCLLIEMAMGGTLALVLYYALVLLGLNTPLWCGVAVFVSVMIVRTVARRWYGR